MQELFSKVECLLFVAGEPVPVTELARVLGLSDTAVRQLLTEMETAYRADGRGVQLLATGETAQLVSNRDYAVLVEQLLKLEIWF